MRVAVVGATGYAGLMLLKLLAKHPRFEVVEAVSEHAWGHPISEFMLAHPRLPERLVSAAEFDATSQADLVFFALGNGEGLQRMRRLVEAKRRVIDLAATFRFNNLDTYTRFYGPHPDPDLHRHSFTGYADDRALVYPDGKYILGNPGCYPTAFAVAVRPLVAALGPLPYLLVDGKSGVSGAGRSPKTHLLLGEMAENVEAYNHPGQHRHTGEMETVSDGVVVFQPHYMPMRQGILLTIYIPKAPGGADDIKALWHEAYRDNPFVVIGPDGTKPRTQTVRDSNQVWLGVDEDPRSGTVVLYSAIDNLVKGAAGQAIQHANRWCGFAPEDGLL